MDKNIIYESEHDTSKTIFTYKNFKSYDTMNQHFHRSVEIIYVTRNNCTITNNESSFIAEQDDILFFKRCDIHSLSYYDSDNIVLVIAPKYSKDFELLFQNKTIDCVLRDKEFNRTLLSYFETLANKTELSDMVIKGFINIIIGKLFDHYPNKKIQHPANMDIIINVLNYIDEHYKETITLESISKLFGYNKYYFSRLFNLTIGQNLNNYLNGVRIRNLIIEASKLEKPNISKMLLDYGFDSFSTFYRTCYKIYNTSPKQLIKNT